MHEATTDHPTVSTWPVTILRNLQCQTNSTDLIWPTSPGVMNRNPQIIKQASATTSAVSDGYLIPDPIIFSNNRTRPDFLRSLYDLTSFTWRYPRRGWWPPGLSEHLVQREEGGSPRVGVGVSSNIRLLIMLMILKLNIIQATSSLMKPISF